MTNKHYVVVNGRAYNTVTGMPMNDIIITSKKATTQPTKQRDAQQNAIHVSHTQRSHTLNRRHVKQPQRKALASRPDRQHQAVSQSVAVKKFAPATPKVAPIKPLRIDRPAETHPVARRAAARPVSNNLQMRKSRDATALTEKPTQKVIVKPLAPKPAKELKNDAIAEALQREVGTKHRRDKKHRSRFEKWASSLSISFAVMLLAGYLTYLSMPNISIRMAAVQSGIDAKYPGYKPDGYALNGPITFNNNEVKLSYAYADGGSSYTLTQQKSNWDSAAVKEYFSESSDKPVTSTIDGLTIYSDGSRAAWVNGGILYEINGNAELSSDQIQKIAASL